MLCTWFITQLFINNFTEICFIIPNSIKESTLLFLILNYCWQLFSPAFHTLLNHSYLKYSFCVLLHPLHHLIACSFTLIDIHNFRNDWISRIPPLRILLCWLLMQSECVPNGYDNSYIRLGTLVIGKGDSTSTDKHCKNAINSLNWELHPFDYSCIDIGFCNF